MKVRAVLVVAIALVKEEDADSSLLVGVSPRADIRSSALAGASCCPVDAFLCGNSLRCNLMLLLVSNKLSARRWGGSHLRALEVHAHR